MNKKFFSLILAAAFVFSACVSSCGIGKKPAMSLKYGETTKTFSSDIYSYYLSYSKTRLLLGYYQTIYGASMPDDPRSLSDIPDLWSQFHSELTSYSSLVKRQAESMLSQFLAIAAHCGENGIELSKKELGDIDDAIDEIIKAYYKNSKSLFNKNLKRFGINDKTYREIKKYEALAVLFGKNLFDSENGKRKITDDMVNAIYEEKCARVKHILILYSPGTYGPDGSPEKFSDDEMAERQAKAEQIYSRIENGEDFDSFLSESEDPGGAAYQNGYTISETTNFIPEFVAAAFDMQIGEVRKVESGYGMHIMKRYELLPAAESLDLDNNATWRNVIYTDRQTYFMDEELKPYIEKIEINTEETKKFNVSKTEIMFDCLELW